MERLVRNWAIALSLATIVGIVVFAGGLAMASKPGKEVLLPGVSSCLLGISFLGLVSWHWRRLLKGKVIWRNTSDLSLSQGSLTIRIPPGDFELWIFCRISFAQYHGRIVITSGGGDEVIEVPRRNPLLYPVRSNLLPIVKRLRASANSTSEKGRVSFRLLPTFPDWPYRQRGQENDAQTITVLVKTR